MFSNIRRDIRFTLRVLRSHPSFTLSVAAIAATSIGLATAIFALADPYVLRGLPYPHPERLLAIEIRRAPATRLSTAPQLDNRLLQRRDVFDKAALLRHEGPVRGLLNDTVVSLRIARCTTDLLDILGLPAAGTSEPFLLLTEASRARFGLDPSAPARFARANGATTTVAGVLPRSFLLPSNHLAFPIDALLVVGQESSATDGTVIARMRADVSIERVRGVLSHTPASAAGATVVVRRLDEFMTRRGRDTGWGALVASALVLLVAVANVGNLVIAQGLKRRREVVTRFILGASRRQVFRLLLLEVMVLGVGSVVLGLLGAGVVLRAANRLAPVEYLALGSPALTLRVCVAVVACGSFFVIAGAVIQWLTSQRAALAASSFVNGGTRTTATTGRLVLIAVQAALSSILITGSVFVVRSYFNVTSQDPGLNTNALAVTAQYGDEAAGQLLQEVIEQTLTRLRQMIEVSEAAAAIGPMLDRTVLMGGFFAGGAGVAVTPLQVTPNYFSVASARMVSGRPLQSGDRGRTGVVVNQRLATMAWPGQSAVGQRVGLRRESEVVGVVQDSFSLAWDVAPSPMVYSLIDQPSGCTGGCNQVTYLIRAHAQKQHPSMDAIQAAVTAVHRDALVLEVSSIDERLRGSIKDRSFAALVLGMFSVGSMLVCALGLGGFVTFVVTSRVHELAIRAALGARAGQLLRVVLVPALGYATLGIAIGSLISIWTSRALVAFLYGVSPGDVPTVCLAIASMMVVVCVAGAVPARRAIQLPPAAVMRQ